MIGGGSEIGAGFIGYLDRKFDSFKFLEEINFKGDFKEHPKKAHDNQYHG